MIGYYAFCAFRVKGEGCDYTIGCDHKIVGLEATNMEDALMEVENYIDENYECQTYGFPYKVITVFEVAKSLEFDIKGYEESVKNKMLEEARKKDEEKNRAEEEKERAEFERLSRKFNKDKNIFF